MVHVHTFIHFQPPRKLKKNQGENLKNILLLLLLLQFDYRYQVVHVYILGKVLVRGVGYFLLYELHVLVGADPSGTTTVCAEEESRLLFSFATLLVSCF